MKARYFVLLLTFFFIAGMLQLRPLDDLDFFMQLRLGLIILSERSLVHQDPFSYSLAGTAIPVMGWLGQLIFAFFYSWGAFVAVKLLHTLLFAASFFIVGLSALKRAEKKDFYPSFFATAAAVLLAFLVTASNSSVRAQTFAFFFFALSLLVFHSSLNSLLKSIFLLPIWLCWQNIHPSLAMMLCYLLLQALVHFVYGFRDKQWRTFAQTCGFIVLVALSYFFTPDGTRLLSVSSQNSIIARNLLEISEWLPPWHPAVASAMTIFWFSLLLSALGIAILRKKVLNEDLLCSLFFAGLSLYAARFSLFYALVSIPLWLQVFEALRPRRILQFSQEAKLSVGAVFCSTLLSAALILSPYFIAPGLLLNPRIPFAQMQALKKQLPAGRIYNYREWGGALSFIGFPRWKLRIDGRLYLYQKDAWRKYYDEAQGLLPLVEILAEQKPDAFFLHPGFQQGLIALLQRDPHWRLFSQSAEALVFLPLTEQKE